MEVNETLMADAQAGFKAARLNPMQAQAVVDLYAKAQQQQAAAWMATTQQWEQQTRNDPEFGKDFEANMGYVRKVVAEYGDDEVRKVFNNYGVGNHPAINKMLAKLGKALGEAPAPRGDGSGSTGGEMSYAQILYGKREPK